MNAVQQCIACGAPLQDGRFCRSCGADQRANEKHLTDRGIRSVLWAFALVIAYILAINLVHLPASPKWELLQDACFFLAVSAAVWYDRKALAPCLSLRGLSLRKAGIALALQAVITLGTLLFAKALGSGHMQDAAAPFRHHTWPYLTALLSVAVFPALSEELAFRAMFFTRLSALMPLRSAILVSGCVFAWVHFSFLSMLWLLPAGLFLGWLRARHGVIWYGVLCHFAHNAVVVLIALNA